MVAKNINPKNKNILKKEVTVSLFWVILSFSDSRFCYPILSFYTEQSSGKQIHSHQFIGIYQPLHMQYLLSLSFDSL